MANYPTPPPTSSPKPYNNSSYRTSDPKLPAQETHFQQSGNDPPYQPSEPKLPAQETYFQQPNNNTSYQASEPKLPTQETYFQQPNHDAAYPPSEPKLPAKDTYFQQSYSTPASPTHWDPSSKLVPNNHNINAASTIHFDAIPPRRKSSPIQYQQPQPIDYPHEPFPRPASTGVSPNTSPYTFRPPRKSSRTPPRPLYSSPLNPISTPYNASRPLPRPGLLKRILGKIEQWIRSFMRWSSKNPIKAGLLTFTPVVATAGIVRAGKVIGKLFGGEKGALGGLGKAAGVKGLEKKEAKKESGYGLGHFVGFAGSKGTGGPLAGVWKKLQMLMYVIPFFLVSTFPSWTSRLSWAR